MIKRFFKISEAADYGATSRSALYEAHKRGQIVFTSLGLQHASRRKTSMHISTMSVRKQLPPKENPHPRRHHGQRRYFLGLDTKRHTASARAFQPQKGKRK